MTLKMPLKQIIILCIFPIVLTACTTPTTTTESSANQPVLQKNNACTVTCYEKTPTCYISQNAPGCLTISYDKPTNSDGTKMCVLPACEKSTTYQLR